MPLRHFTGYIGTLAVAACAALPLHAQQLATVQRPAASPAPSLEAPRAIRAVRVDAPVRIDGRIDEAAWATADVASDFVQQQPQVGQPSTERTEVRVLYDADAVYVAARMSDPHPDSMEAPLARRDAAVTNSEWFNLVLDSFHDRRTAFRFGVNPAGLRRDVYHFDDGASDASWDAVWDVATSTDSAGWTAEFRIPLSQLRFNAPAAGAEQTWGVQFFRYIARRDEWSYWAPYLPTQAGFVSRFGELRELRGLAAPRRLELLPYTSARVDRRPDRGEVFDGGDATGGSAGLDVKMGVTSGLTLTATVNPDFGQVELDPAVVNLTAFETQLSERRPFFVEGADAFRFGQLQNFNGYGNPQFFYSRRVGRAPQHGFFVGGDGVHDVRTPEQSTILAAAKLSGRPAEGWTLGFMNAVTQREAVRWTTGDGEERSHPVEPMTNYFIGRVRRDLNGGATTVGGMLTGVNRDLSDDVLEPLLRRNAYVGGLDFEHSWSRRLWTVSGYVASSRVSGSAESIARTQQSSAHYFQRPDAEHLRFNANRTSLAGTSAALAVQRSGDWDMSVQLRNVTPGWEMNDIGFAPRSDVRSLATFVGRRITKPLAFLRQYSMALFTTQAWNTGGDAVYAEGGIGLNGTTHGLWNGGLNLGVSPETRDDRLTRGGPLGAAPASWNLSAYLNSDPRPRLSVSGSVYASGDRAGGSAREGGISLGYRPDPSVQLSIGPSFSVVRDPDQYLFPVEDAAATETFGTRHVFSRLHQTTFSMNTRLDWTFTPTLSLQLFAQPFVAAGDFRDFREFTTPGESEYAVYGRDRGTVCAFTGADGGRMYALDPVAAVTCPANADEAAEREMTTTADPDFNIRSLRGNAVLRWEYRPGSALFFVWQQERSGFEPLGDFDARRDVGRLFREPARNVFLVKATYWIG
jgi:hypothetical protein